MKTNNRSGKAGYIINGWPNHDRPEPAHINRRSATPSSLPTRRELFLAFVVGPAIFGGLLLALIGFHSIMHYFHP